MMNWEFIRDGDIVRLYARIGDREYMLNITGDGVTWAGSTRPISYRAGDTWGHIDDCSFVTLDKAIASCHDDYLKRIITSDPKIKKILLERLKKEFADEDGG